VLVLDEANSALDTCTEVAVMAALEFLSKELTIVMIAHRLRSVQRYDRIICLEHGSVVDQGCPVDVMGGLTSKYLMQFVNCLNRLIICTD
jgi:ATP-binding cassette subfamily B protein